ISQQKRLIQDIKSVYEKDQRWPGVGRVDYDLKWVPFPVEFGRVALKEMIQGDGSTEQYLVDLGITETVDFDGLTWKPEGLQILRDCDEELEGNLSQGSSYNEQDLSSLLGKRNSNTDINGEEASKRVKAHKCERVHPNGSSHQD